MGKASVKLQWKNTWARTQQNQERTQKSQEGPLNTRENVTWPSHAHIQLQIKVYSFPQLPQLKGAKGSNMWYMWYIFQRVSNRFCCWDERPSQREGMAPMDARFEQILTHARMPSCISRMSHAAFCVFVFVEVLASGCYAWGGVCNVLSFFWWCDETLVGLGHCTVKNLTAWKLKLKKCKNDFV